MRVPFQALLLEDPTENHRMGCGQQGAECSRKKKSWGKDSLGVPVLLPRTSNFKDKDVSLDGAGWAQELGKS